MGNTQIAVPFKKEEPIVYKGRLNKTICPEFINLCRKTQEQMKVHLVTELGKYGYEVETGDGYVYAEGKNVPVLLTAHMDTVHKEPVKDYYEQTKGKRAKKKHIVSSPQGIGGDDRCGIYMILEILKTTELRPTILFCEDEEIGGVGSNKFLKTTSANKIEELKFFVELDRCGKSDAVFYDCITDDFIEFIEKETGYKENWGSFSDISNLSPWSGVASVNLSCGYYKAHTLAEYVVLEEMFNTIEVTKHLLGKAMSDEVPMYIYEEATWADKYGTYYGGNFTSGGWFDDDRWDTYDTYNYNSGYKETTKKYGILYVMWTEDGKLKDTEVYAESKLEAIGSFLMAHSNLRWLDIEDYDWIPDKYESYGWSATDATRKFG